MAVAAGAVIVGCVTVPASFLARFLSLSGLVFIGRISYGLYLYHWPLFLAIDHAHTGLSGNWLLGTRLVVTFAVATASFFLVEEPIRSGRAFRGRLGLCVGGAAAVVTAVAVVLATVAPVAGATAAPRGGGLSSTERRSLVTAGAFAGHPIRFVMVGDSVGLTLGVGLGVDSRDNYGVRLFDGGDARLRSRRRGGATVRSRPGRPRRGASTGERGGELASTASALTWSAC